MSVIKWHSTASSDPGHSQRIGFFFLLFIEYSSYVVMNIRFYGTKLRINSALTKLKDVKIS